MNFWTVLGGANREIKLQTLEKAALSRAKERHSLLFTKHRAELKMHQKEKKSYQSKTQIMRSNLYRRVRKLKVVHNEGLQQKQTLKKQLHDTTKEISTLKKVSLQKRNQELKKTKTKTFKS